MKKGLTPTITMTFPAEIDFDDMDHIVFTMKQNNRTVIEKWDSQLTISDNVVTVWLSQAETLALSVGEASYQLDWTYPEDANHHVNRGGSDIHTIIITENLKCTYIEGKSVYRVPNGKAP